MEIVRIKKRMAGPTKKKRKMKRKIKKGKESDKARGAAGNVVILFGWGGVISGSQQGI